MTNATPFPPIITSNLSKEREEKFQALREPDQLVAMATLKVQQTQDGVRYKTLKAFGDHDQGRKAVKRAADLSRFVRSAKKPPPPRRTLLLPRH